MSSKALYLSKVPPKLIRRFDAAPGGRAVEIWTTTCIVLNFDNIDDGSTSSVLINPANPQLTGTSQFSYFPRGGPVPKKVPQISAHHIMPYVSQWGGIEVEHGMMFDTSAVDGMVHLYGGWGLQTELLWKRLQTRLFRRDDETCPVSEAVMTSAGKERLALTYDHVIHTAPPFYRHNTDKVNPEDALQQCYASSLRLAKNHDRIATPVLGAGCRGFPMDVAFDIAAESSVAWCRGRDGSNGIISNKQQILAFGLLEAEWANELTRLVESKF
jgi:O-acetyl-ADP-ribose deacetylase (regulator of RNase III)